ncbi:hypothetical protein B0H63DRAFT_131502 [Podospora didyma]|uniref:Zn(2)-C6 fungal-type domain-containing protein n=1 Tax=Podospora didyma TaxID=330526 RepID=A0AAE0P0J5_9PEZI|nr:hypothetical protein B0H63DRAFT_131502 [Podospora didyma]
MELSTEDEQLNGAADLALQSPPLPPDSTASATDPPPPPASDTGADAGSEAPVNPRKRRKASRACDFCHVNHQPCDNGKPKCSMCSKHNKPCLYLRPTKRRGPQKGYRTALNTYKDSAAAWGAVLGAIPGLEALIEGHLRTATGKGVVASLKDPNQQEAFINRWQESLVFRAFFGHNGSAAAANSQVGEGDGANAHQQDADEDDLPGDETISPPSRPPPAKRPLLGPNPYAIKRSLSPSYGGAAAAATATTTATATAIMDPKSLSLSAPSVSRHHQARVSLSDIVARDAAQGSSRASQTLASLGFAPDETIADFYSMGSNPEPISNPNDQEFDPALGSESEQRAFYELLMGRSFPG